MTRSIVPSTQQDIILNFQMAKVASRSWSALLHETFPTALISHFHVISKQRMNKAAQVVTATDYTQTIKHMTLPRLGRPGESISPFIGDNLWHGPPVVVISGVRDPVARAISAVSFLCNRLGYRKLPVTPRDGGTPKNILEVFHRACYVARHIDQGTDTLLTLLADTIGNFDKWFTEELKPAFDLDIGSAQFDRDARALVVRGRHKALIYRVEDLIEPSARNSLLRTAGIFFNCRFSHFPTAQTDHEQRYQALYKEVKSALRLSEKELDWFYDNPTMRHFYSEAEIEGFRRHWAR